MTLHARAAIHASVVVILAAPLAGACHSQETPMPSRTPADAGPLAVEEVFGLWALRPESGEGRCRIALGRLPAGEAYGVHIERCTIGAVADGAGWRPVPDGFELLDGGGRVLMRFRRTGVDAFVAVDGAYRLDRAPTA